VNAAATQVYSTLSTASMASVIIGFYRGGKGPVVRNPGRLARSLGATLQAIGLVGISQQLPPIVGERQERRPGEPFGMERVTRHAQLWPLGLLGLGTALAARNAGVIAFWGFPVAFITIGTHHQVRSTRLGTRAAPCLIADRAQRSQRRGARGACAGLAFPARDRGLAHARAGGGNVQCSVPRPALRHPPRQRPAPPPTRPGTVSLNRARGPATCLNFPGRSAFA